MPRRTIAAEIEFALGDGRFLVGNVEGDVCPAEPDVGLMSDYVDGDPFIKGKIYSGADDDVGVEYSETLLTAEQLKQVEQRAVDALCDVYSN